MEAKEKSQGIKSIYGILLQALSVCLFSSMIIGMRYLYKTTTFNPIEVLIWRSLLLVLFNICFAQINSVDIIAIRKKESRVVFWRAITGALAATGFFSANFFLPPSISSAITKLNPLITNIISVIMMNEKVSNVEVLGMVVAFGGVLMIIFDPSKIKFSLAEYLSQIYLFSIPLFTTVMQSINAVFTRIMGKSLHYIISPTCLGLSTTIFVFPLLLAVLSLRGYVTAYNTSNVCLLFLVGFFGWAAQIALSLSLIHICRCRRYAVCRSRWSPYH
eukprot:TRINITY_DN8800_c0_g3_i2.p1 TRINITY_DN8800_c0_g3~~TRINITY_DN8800_c0_g3_i2.p1  ORF type:complete len:274 (-),score=47.66 TRINITY_DN8800_c0_g3_i2:16-837(-)